jgi:hypothetical protein
MEDSNNWPFDDQNIDALIQPEKSQHNNSVTIRRRRIFDSSSDEDEPQTIAILSDSDLPHNINLKNIQDEIICQVVDVLPDQAVLETNLFDERSEAIVDEEYDSDGNIIIIESVSSSQVLMCILI